MPSKCKLILVEGLCGMGKSTLAELLHRNIENQGVPSSFYDEGAYGHPASLNWHAFFRNDEYKELLDRYPNLNNEISVRTIQDGENRLIPYRGVKEFTELNTLYSELEAHELCWTDSPRASLSEFTYLIQRQWARFAQQVITSEKVYVLEAVFFQHQIHDLLRNYQAADRQIKEHIHGIADQIAVLNPVLIYLTQPNVREQQTWISSIRSKPQLATEQNIMFMENRSRIELELLSTLSFPTYTIENENLDWEDVFNKMVSAIDKNII